MTIPPRCTKGYPQTISPATQIDHYAPRSNALTPPLGLPQRSEGSTTTGGPSPTYISHIPQSPPGPPGRA
ncbi:MAG: hypothetical protein ACLQNE_04825, partial [Thermoguttaceae bacterium]